jgi:AcrR family transcriptional regulator
MGRKERRVREQEELRQSILEAAREIARAEGWRNVTMRKIAERIEYSHPAIYDYFENKEVLLRELVHEGFRLLEATLRAAQNETRDPVETLRLIGRAYLTFAWNYPELYRVMYGLDGVAFTSETHGEGQQIEDVVVEAVRRLLEVRGWPVQHLAEKVNILWSTAHGLVTLVIADRITGGQEQAMRLLDLAIQGSLLAWEHPQQLLPRDGALS